MGQILQPADGFLLKVTYSKTLCKCWLKWPYPIKNDIATHLSILSYLHANSAGYFWAIEK